MDREKLKSFIKESALKQNLKIYDFSDLILEAKKAGDIGASTGSGGDAAGKAFEIHVAKHIGHILRGGSDPEQHYPEHFSDESGDTPQNSAAKQKKVVGEHLYNQIERHSRRMAHHIVNHLKKKGIKLDHTSKVTWTSKPKDLERLTGVKGIKGTADITVSHDGQHHGISLKYTSAGASPSLRSPGIKDLNTGLKADTKHVDNILKNHDKSVDNAVGHLVGQGSKKERHQRFKQLKASNHPSTQVALEASKSAHKALASHYSDSFNKLSHAEKTGFIRKMTDAEEAPTIQPYRAGYDATKNKSYVSNPSKEFDEIHSRTSHYTSEPSGASMNIFAHHHDGTKTKVASVGLKNKGSSPYTAITGRVADTAKKSVLYGEKKKIKVKKKKK